MNGRRQSKNQALEAERLEILRQLNELEPLSPLGENLIALSRRGVEEGVEPLTIDEVNEYLGRERVYADVH